MKRIPLSQGQFALVDDEDYDYLNQWRWYADRSGQRFYAARNRRKSDGPGPTKIYMHRVIRVPFNGAEVDHVNGDGLDCRRVNLRAVTHAINSANQVHRRRGRNLTLPMGVRTRNRRKFQAQIGIDGHNNYLGTFATPAEANAAYVAARRERIATDNRSHNHLLRRET